jgi:hypothetical protein
MPLVERNLNQAALLSAMRREGNAAHSEPEHAPSLGHITLHSRNTNGIA